MSGYIGTQPVPQATQTRDAFTATNNQTSFPTSGYTPEFLDVFLNGVKLAASDYTATNGSDVVLAAGATTGDILEVVSYGTFEVLNPTFDGTVTFTGSASFDGYITINDSVDLNGTLFPNSIFMADSQAIVLGTGADVELSWGGSYLNLNTKGNDIRIMDGLTTKVHYDASTTSLGIGTSSPSANLEITQSGNNVGLLVTGGAWNYTAKFESSDAEANIIIEDSNSTNNGNMIGVATNDMYFITNNTERMRIDSSGNLLVGKSSTAFGSAGIEARSGGTLWATASGTNAASFNRLSSDGVIAYFNKDGAAVGSIGSVSGVDLFVAGNRGAGQRYLLDNILPCNSTGNVTNGDIDLGTADYKYRDLFLGGGIQFDARSNKLEDYEEGTWTASFGGTNASNISNTTGYYTKIGNTVHFTYYSSQVDLANAVTGGARIYGLPFTSSNTQHRYGLFLTSYGNAIQNESNGGFVANNGTYMLFMIQESNSETTWYNGTNKRIMVAGTYMVD